MIASSAQNSSAQSKPQNSTQWPTFTSYLFSLNFTYKFNVKNITEISALTYFATKILCGIWNRWNKLRWELNTFFMFKKPTELFWISTFRTSAKPKRKKLCFALENWIFPHKFCMSFQLVNKSKHFIKSILLGGRETRTINSR